MIRTRKFCGTLNNFSNEECTSLETIECDNLIYQKEVGEEGTPHLQFSIRFKWPRTEMSVRKMIPRAHIEVVKHWNASVNYCMKEDTRMVGTDPYIKNPDEIYENPGQRTDLIALKAALVSPRWKEELMENHLASVLHYSKGIQLLRAWCLPSQKETYISMAVYVVWGKTGCGKSRWTHENFPGHYTFRSSSLNEWWDGYQGETAICFDDFNDTWFPIERWLALTDGYQVDLPYKGGFLSKNYRTVIFTSNKDPKRWYPKAIPAHREAMFRRITFSTEVTGNTIGNLLLLKPPSDRVQPETLNQSEDAPQPLSRE